MKLFPAHAWFLIVLLGLFATTLGCGSSTDSEAHDDDHHGETAHDGHDEKAPHGGHLLELGHDHSYHAEIVEDDAAKSLVVYILGGEMQELPIAAANISMSLTVDEETKSFELAAVDPLEGKSAKFAAEGSDLFQLFEDHHDDLNGKLRVTIDGTPYVADIDHAAHDHAGHDHD